MQKQASSTISNITTFLLTAVKTSVLLVFLIFFIPIVFFAITDFSGFIKVICSSITWLICKIFLVALE